MVACHGRGLQGPEEEGEVGPGKMNRCIREGCQSVRQRAPCSPVFYRGEGEAASPFQATNDASRPRAKLLSPRNAYDHKHLAPKGSL